MASIGTPRAAGARCHRMWVVCVNFCSSKRSRDRGGGSLVRGEGVQRLQRGRGKTAPSMLYRLLGSCSYDSKAPSFSAIRRGVALEDECW